MQTVAVEGTEALQLRPKRTKKSPATQMREYLTVSRRYGVDFEKAWSSAWERIRWPHDTSMRREWKAELASERDVWEACYERRGKANRGLIAVYALLTATEESLREAA